MSHEGEDKIITYLSSIGCDVISRAPGAFFLFGEYAVAN